MSLNDVWHKLDQKMQEKFHGEYGEAAFREVVVIAGMFYAHRYLKLTLPAEHHPAVDKAWYGSLFPDHPMHGVRVSVQNFISDIAQDVADLLGKPMQRKFQWFDTTLVPAAERHIDRLLSPPRNLR